MNLRILEPHGFCAGVTGALRKALALADEEAGLAGRSVPAGPRPLYCLHELVHNELVAADLARRGFAFVETLDEVPDGATVLFSAHGVSPAVRARAAARNLTVVDATCPFVARVHRAAADFAARGLPVVVIGHPGHAEVAGILGEAPDASVVRTADDARAFVPPVAGTALGVVSQTTMNADDVAGIVGVLRARFTVETMAEVCRATKERQDAVKAFDGDALLVLGSAHSSNTRRLCEVARCRTFRAGTLDEVKRLDFSGVGTLGVTSGASTPEDYFEKVLYYLRSLP